VKTGQAKVAKATNLDFRYNQWRSALTQRSQLTSMDTIALQHVLGPALKVNDFLFV